MWDGAFAPRVRKHRDYMHSSVFTHLMANGGSYTIDPQSVDVKYRPVDAHLHEPSDRYYFVDVDLGPHSGGTLRFLIHSESDLSEPNEERIRDEVDAMLTSPIIGGRDWFDYLDFESERTLTHPFVAARIEAGDTPPTSRPVHRRNGDYSSFTDSWLDSL